MARLDRMRSPTVPLYKFDSAESSMLCLEKIHNPSEKGFDSWRIMKRLR